MWKRAFAWVVLAGAVSNRSLADVSYYFDATSCGAKLGSNNANIWRLPANGLAATVTTEVYCPIKGNESDDIDLVAARVDYGDSSNVRNLRCRVGAQASDGTIYISPYRHSCAAAGGCANAPGDETFVGYGYILFSNPLNGGALMSDLTAYYVDCTLPDTVTVHIGRFVVTQMAR